MMKIEYFCDKCGQPVEVEVFQFIDGILRTKVKPCGICAMKYRQEGWDEGYEKGYSEGLIERQTS